MLSLELGVSSLAVLNKGGGALVERNIAMGGRVLTTLGNPPSGKLRNQGRYKFTVLYPAKRVRVIFSMRYVTTATGGELAAPYDIALAKCAIEQGSSYAPVLFAGAAGKTLISGTAAIASDATSFDLAVGVAWVRLECDVAAGTQTYPFGKYYSNSTFEGAGAVEQSYFYTAGSEPNNMYGTGPLSSSGGTGQVGYPPMILVGEVSPGLTAIIGCGDSIADGFLDFPSNSGAAGDGFLKRAAYSLGVPYFGVSLPGWSALRAVNSQIFPAMCAYHKRAITEFGTNDIAAGQTDGQTLANLRAIWGYAATAGIADITQTKILPRVSTANLCTTTGAQTPISQFGSGGYVDALNTSFDAEVGSNGLSAIADMRAVVADGSDHHLWAVRAYASTLAASCLQGATSVSLNDAPTVGEGLAFDPGGASQSTGSSRVSAVTGAGPYTATLLTAPGVAQSSGAAVKGTPAPDGVHPVPVVNAEMAAALVSALA